MASIASMAMPARRCRCIFSLQEVPKSANGTLRLDDHRLRRHAHGDFGCCLTGSLRPKVAGLPQFPNLAVRALCRWQASCIMVGVAVPLGTPVALVRSPACTLLSWPGAAVVHVVVVCAAAERAPSASVTVRLADSISPRKM